MFNVRNFVFGLCLLGPVISCSVFAVTFEQAMTYYGNKQFEQAYGAFEELAALGNERAQLNVGVMYARGEFVERDFVESAAWLKLSNDTLRNDSATKILKIISAKLSEEDQSTANARYKKLSKKYGREALDQRLFPESAIDEVSDFVGAEPLRKRVPKFPRMTLMVPGIVDVQYSVAIDGTVRNITILRATENVFRKNTIEAVRYNLYKPAAINGKSIPEFGRRMRFNYALHGSKLDADGLQGVVAPIREKAEQGGGLDKYLYAYTLTMLRSVVGGLEDSEGASLDPAADWFKKAAQDGNRLAKFELGLDLSYGKQCRADSKKSYFWLEQAADEGVMDAQVFLGSELLHGGRFEKDVDKGLQMLARAADGGYDDAILKLAWIMATHPDANVRDPQKALAYLNRFNNDDYIDELTVFETQAVVYALTGKNADAKKALKKAMKYRKKYELPDGISGDIAKAFDAGKPYLQDIL
ncbi:energy transducer TonB [Teredinibacter turnerae]|uniref:energy transducer TonB n=1 Tax=Teredinibacter turnerae TaxID=2426 RepID=UPI00041AD7F8|nr:energy transducer TonB [Teredinibacter turnerae]